MSLRTCPGASPCSASVSVDQVLDVVDHVAVPGAHARRLQRQPIALFAGAQGGLGLLAGDELFFGRQTRAATADALLQRVLQPSGRSAIASHDRSDLGHPRLQLGGGNRSAEKVALRHVTAQAGQHIPGRAILDAFGHDPQLQRVGQVDDGPHDRPRARRRSPWPGRTTGRSSARRPTGSSATPATSSRCRSRRSRCARPARAAGSGSRRARTGSAIRLLSVISSTSAPGATSQRASSCGDHLGQLRIVQRRAATG